MLNSVFLYNFKNLFFNNTFGDLLVRKIAGSIRVENKDIRLELARFHDKSDTSSGFSLTYDGPKNCEAVLEICSSDGSVKKEIIKEGETRDFRDGLPISVTFRRLYDPEMN